MTVTSAGKWLILASLIITGLQMLFLIAAPAFGFPLTYPKNLDLLEIVSPVFLAYLGSASHFIFQNPAPRVPVQNQFLGYLVIGPVVIYLAAVAGTLSAALGVLAVTTGVISSYLFVAPQSQVP